MPLLVLLQDGALSQNLSDAGEGSDEDSTDLRSDNVAIDVVLPIPALTISIAPVLTEAGGEQDKNVSLVSDDGYYYYYYDNSSSYDEEADSGIDFNATDVATEANATGAIEFNETDVAIEVIEIEVLTMAPSLAPSLAPTPVPTLAPTLAPATPAPTLMPTPMPTVNWVVNADWVAYEEPTTAIRFTLPPAVPYVGDAAAADMYDDLPRAASRCTTI